MVCIHVPVFETRAAEKKRAKSRWCIAASAPPRLRRSRPESIGGAETNACSLHGARGCPANGRSSPPASPLIDRDAALGAARSRRRHLGRRRAATTCSAPTPCSTTWSTRCRGSRAAGSCTTAWSTTRACRPHRSGERAASPAPGAGRGARRSRRPLPGAARRARAQLLPRRPRQRGVPPRPGAPRARRHVVVILTLGADAPVPGPPLRSHRRRPVARPRARVRRRAVMGGACQREWEHGVPKVAPAGPRVSAMWRWAHRPTPDALRRRHRRSSRRRAVVVVVGGRRVVSGGGSVGGGSTTGGPVTGPPPAGRSAGGGAVVGVGVVVRRGSTWWSSPRSWRSWSTCSSRRSVDAGRLTNPAPRPWASCGSLSSSPPNTA